MPELSHRCPQAPRTLYWAFRGDPLFTRVFREKGRVLSFFEAIGDFLREGALLSVCVREKGVTVAVAVLSFALSWTRVPRRALWLLARSLGPRGLLEVASWLGQSLRYWAATRRLENYCHLLFLASAVGRRGYGSLALSAAEKACRRIGGAGILLDVDAENPALLLYYRRGYRPLGEAFFSGRRYVVMAKPFKAGGGGL